ncbi:MAG: cytochrome c [Lutibacter sp.]|nr:cytochrome c [Lutibacter sp.]
MKLKGITWALIALFMWSCGGDAKKPAAKVAAKEEVAAPVELDPVKDKGIGPIKSLTLAAIDEGMVAKGKDLYKSKCSACHKISKRFVGPALGGITERRTPEWVMNMILNPEEMVAKNPIAKKLLEEYISPMANQSLTEEEARLILEYFRTKTSN